MGLALWTQPAFRHFDSKICQDIIPSSPSEAHVWSPKSRGFISFIPETLWIHMVSAGVWVFLCGQCEANDFKSKASDGPINAACADRMTSVEGWNGEMGRWLPSIWHFPINIGLLITPIDELIFFRGVAQPPTRNVGRCPLWFLQVFTWSVFTASSSRHYVVSDLFGLSSCTGSNSAATAAAAVDVRARLDMKSSMSRL